MRWLYPYAGEMRVEDLPERAAKLARILGEEFHGCAQMTLKALQETFGLTDIEVFKAASPLSGGIARSGQICGSLLGALLFVGVVFGRKRLERTDMSEDYRRAMEVAEKVYDEFEKEFGTTICKEIHKRLFGRVYNLRDPGMLRSLSAQVLGTGAPRSCLRPPRSPLEGS